MGHIRGGWCFIGLSEVSNALFVKTVHVWILPLVAVRRLLYGESVSGLKGSLITGFGGSSSKRSSAAV